MVFTGRQMPSGAVVRFARQGGQPRRMGIPASDFSSSSSLHFPLSATGRKGAKTPDRGPKSYRGMDPAASEWEDITTQFKRSLAEEAPEAGRVMSHPHSGFSLLESMSALEMLDPRMDHFALRTGGILSPENWAFPPAAQDWTEDMVRCTMACLLINFARYAVDRLPMAYSLLTSLHALRPQQCSHPAVRAVALSHLRIAGIVRGCLMDCQQSGSVWEEDEFSSSTSGAVTGIEEDSADLKALLDSVGKSDPFARLAGALFDVFVAVGRRAPLKQLRLLAPALAAAIEHLQKLPEVTHGSLQLLLDDADFMFACCGWHPEVSARLVGSQPPRNTSTVVCRSLGASLENLHRLAEDLLEAIDIVESSIELDDLLLHLRLFSCKKPSLLVRAFFLFRYLVPDADHPSSASSATAAVSSSGKDANCRTASESAEPPAVILAGRFNVNQIAATRLSTLFPSLRWQASKKSRECFSEFAYLYKQFVTILCMNVCRGQRKALKLVGSIGRAQSSVFAPTDAELSPSNEFHPSLLLSALFCCEVLSFVFERTFLNQLVNTSSSSDLFSVLYYWDHVCTIANRYFCLIDAQHRKSSPQQRNAVALSPSNVVLGLNSARGFLTKSTLWSYVLYVRTGAFPIPLPTAGAQPASGSDSGATSQTPEVLQHWLRFRWLSDLQEPPFVPYESMVQHASELLRAPLGDLQGKIAEASELCKRDAMSGLVHVANSGTKCAALVHAYAQETLIRIADNNRVSSSLVGRLAATQAMPAGPGCVSGPPLKVQVQMVEVSRGFPLLKPKR